MLSLQPGGAQAATFVVNSTADVVDAAPGNGVCATAGGVCTLRAAIMEANALFGADTITLPAGTYTLSIPGTGENAAATGDLDITGNLAINGAGAASTIIDGGGIDRVFDVRPGATVEIDGVTVRNGKPGVGGAGGGGISNQGTMTLTNSTVTSNTDGIGGGIYNHGTMTVNSSTVSGNSGAGGVYSSADGLGGGVFNDGTMTVNRSTVSGNTAPGVYWFSPGGGGIFNNIPGSMTVTNSTVSGNTAGTGVVNLSGRLTIESSTISGNTGNTGYGGGGILNFSWTAIATTSVFSSTIAENRNLTGRGDAIADISSLPGSVILKNSIVASPTQGLGGDCYIAAGVLTSLGHNIASDTSCAGLTGGGDLNSTDPLLGPLANNGGPTQTHAPLLGGPAIDAVPLADCTDVNGVPIATDQRGVARPLGASCDIGAHEVEPTCLEPPSGLVSWWPGDGDALDIVGTNDGTPQNGAAFTPAGMVDRAFSFDGVNDFVSVPNSATLNPAGSFTIGGWVYPRSHGFQAIVAKWGDAGDHANQRSYVLNNTSTGVLNFGISDAAHQVDGAFHTLITPPGALALNAWNHFAIVYDHSTGTREIFVDGNLRATRTDPPITVLNGAARFGIGAYLPSSTTSTAHFDGFIDEVQFFDRALSVSEILAIFNAAGVGQCKTVVSPNQPPVANAGPDQTVEATGPSGASVALNGSGSSDPDGDALAYDWTGSFGAVSGVSPTVPLPLGTHTVILTVDDGLATATDTVDVTVRDTTAPETTITSVVDGNGAAVAGGGSTLSDSITFALGGTDAVGVAAFQCRLDGAAYVPCASPVGYSSLAIGNHTFQVRAVDAAGNIDPSPASFTWTVVTPAQAIQNLITTINNMGLPGGVATSLTAPLNNINTNNKPAACGKLGAFINQVNAKTPPLTGAQATQLLQAANAIKASLGC